jgi:hypothetical protein
MKRGRLTQNAQAGLDVSEHPGEEKETAVRGVINLISDQLLTAFDQALIRLILGFLYYPLKAPVYRNWIQ